MGDFTKEELQHILGAFNYALGSGEGGDEELLKKIRYMIHNVKHMINTYCDCVHAVFEGELKCIYCRRSSNIKIKKHTKLNIWIIDERVY